MCVGYVTAAGFPPTPHPCYCSGARMEMLALAPTADHTCLECADTSLGAPSICPAVWAPGRTSPGQRSKLRLQPGEASDHHPLGLPPSHLVLLLPPTGFQTQAASWGVASVYCGSLSGAEGQHLRVALGGCEVCGARRRLDMGGIGCAVRQAAMTSPGAWIGELPSLPWPPQNGDGKWKPGAWDPHPRPLLGRRPVGPLLSTPTCPAWALQAAPGCWHLNFPKTGCGIWDFSPSQRLAWLPGTP